MEPNPILYGQQNNSQKIRFIVVTAIVAVVVLGIAVWAIVAMVSGKNRVANTNETVAVEEHTDDNLKKDENEKKSEDITSSTEGVITTIPASPAPETPKEDIPSTGPEDILPLALALGALTTFAGSALLAKRA